MMGCVAHALNRAYADQRHAMTMDAIFDRYCYHQDDAIEAASWCRNHGGETTEYVAMVARMNSLMFIIDQPTPSTPTFPWKSK